MDSKKGLLKFKDKSNDTAEDGIIIKEQYENSSEDGHVSIISFASELGPIGNPKMDNYNLSKGEELDLENLGKLTVENIVNKDNKTLITMRTTGFISIDDIQIINGQDKVFPSEIVNKEIYGDLDMKATYVFSQLNLDTGLSLSVYHPKLLEQLSNQTIKIDSSNLK